MIKKFFAKLTRFGENPENKFKRQNQEEREAAELRRQQNIANQTEGERLRRLAEDMRTQTESKDKAA